MGFGSVAARGRASAAGWLLSSTALLATLLATLLAAFAAHAGERAYLWQAQRGAATITLFGSIHLCRADCFPLPDLVVERLDGAEVLAVELDPQQPGRGDEMLRRATYAAGDRLDRHLPPALARELVVLLTAHGLPEEAVLRMKPWLAGMTLTLVAAMHAGYTADDGIDLWLIKRAREQGKRVAELESVDEQLEALDALPAPEQAAMVAQSVDLAKRGELAGYIERLVGAWQAGDPEALWRLSQEGVEDRGLAERMLDGLLDARNRSMGERLAALAGERGRVFAAVGALHLAGPRSVLTELRQAGWTVRQLP